MNGIRFKDGVLPIAHLAPAGVRILGSLDTTARRFGVDLLVTCADKEHPAADPHSTGEAFDVRTHDLPDEQKRMILRSVMLDLSDDGNPQDAPVPTSGGLATLNFFGWIEHPGEPGEHLHVQRRKATVYAPQEALKA